MEKCQLAWKIALQRRQAHHAGRAERHRDPSPQAVPGGRGLRGLEGGHPQQRFPAGLPGLGAGDRLPARHEPYAGPRGDHPAAGGRLGPRAVAARRPSVRDLPRRHAGDLRGDRRPGSRLGGAAGGEARRGAGRDRGRARRGERADAVRAEGRRPGGVGQGGRALPPAPGGAERQRAAAAHVPHHHGPVAPRPDAHSPPAPQADRLGARPPGHRGGDRTARDRAKKHRTAARDKLLPLLAQFGMRHL